MRLRGGQEEEEAREVIHFIGPEKEGATYRVVVLRKRNQQRALFPEFDYNYHLYLDNTDWPNHKAVLFYRKRGGECYQEAKRRICDGPFYLRRLSAQCCLLSTSASDL